MKHFDLIRVFEINLHLCASQLAQGHYDHFEHLNEAKNHAKALRQTYSAFRQRTNFSCSAINLESILRLFQVCYKWICSVAQHCKPNSQEQSAGVLSATAQRKFSHLRTHVARKLCLFASSYLCEQGYSKMTFVN